MRPPDDHGDVGARSAHDALIADDRAAIHSRRASPHVCVP
jgi:hypothetical protein